MLNFLFIIVSDLISTLGKSKILDSVRHLAFHQTCSSASRRSDALQRLPMSRGSFDRTHVARLDGSPTLRSSMTRLHSSHHCPVHPSIIVTGQTPQPLLTTSASKPPRTLMRGVTPRAPGFTSSYRWQNTWSPSLSTTHSSYDRRIESSLPE
jgi:hypothetical protein